MTDENTAIVPRPGDAITQLSENRLASLRQAIAEQVEQRAMLKAYVESAMVEGVDYGVIPGTKKPTLLKPGSEKLIDLFRAEPDCQVVTRLEDWEQGLFNYEVRCEIKNEAGKVVAIGFGSANSREGRYRYRDGQRVCPECNQATIIKGKEDFGGGWLCFLKKGGCGAKWPDGAEAIEDQKLGKVENDDIFTIVNTLLKMAKKRAQVDAAIALARCSDMFTQDVEDFAPRGEREERRDRGDAQKSRGRERKHNDEMPPVDVFSDKVRWAGKDKWKGKSLTLADTEVLNAYADAVVTAIDDPAAERAGALPYLKQHYRKVELAISVKQGDHPPEDGTDPSDPEADDTSNPGHPSNFG